MRTSGFSFFRLPHCLRKLFPRIVQNRSQGVLRCSLGQRLAAGRILLVQAPQPVSRIFLHSPASRSKRSVLPASSGAFSDPRSIGICFRRNSLSHFPRAARSSLPVIITLGSSRCARPSAFCAANISCVVILRSVSKPASIFSFKYFSICNFAVPAFAPPVWCR